MGAVPSPSIVMFTYGRPSNVRRLSDYYRDYPGQLIIMDGSRDPVAGLSMPVGGQYHHRPGARPIQRVAEGLSYVTAPTCALSADDDFHSFVGLRRCAEAIAGGSGIACAAGTAIYFETSGNAVEGSVADSAVERLLHVDAAPDGARRFRSMLEASPQVFYSCLRTGVAQRVARMLEPIAFEDALVGEQLWMALPSLFGRCVFIDTLQLVRRWGAVDYSGYVASFRGLEDIAHWPGFAALAVEVRKMAAEAGADVSAAEAVIDAWRDFAAETTRGRRNRRSRRMPATVRTRRLIQNALVNMAVAASPRAWRNPHFRRVIRGHAQRWTLHARSYPWSDPLARTEFERIMAFDRSWGATDTPARAPAPRQPAGTGPPCAGT